MLKPTYLVLSAASLALLHLICLLVFPAQAIWVTYPFMLAAPILALFSCARRAFVEPSELRSPWVLLGAGMFLWTSGMILCAWEDIFQHLPPTVAWFSDVLFFLYGVPVLLTIASVSVRQRMSSFIWMDAAQALLTGFLSYVTIFSVVPFSDTPLAPVDTSTLVLTYNAENLILAVAASVRLLAQPRGEERRFYAVMTGFLWSYAISAALYNDWAALTNGHGPMDVLVDLPFLLLAVAATQGRPARTDVNVDNSKHALSLFVENVSPIFYTVALFALSISLMREHFLVGAVGTFIGLVIYATRSTLVQGRYIRVQRELQEVRDRLEQMALTDALTNTANRRHFDETLVLEWNRAIRHRQSLALLLVDIDYFKMLNDRYGHPAGDRCLAAIARALQSAMPHTRCLLARYGGEEFAAILPSTSEADARTIALAMQDAVRTLEIHNETPTGLNMTISVGIAVFESPLAGTPADMVEAADQALYRAKERGRNRIETAAEGEFLNDATQ